MLFNALWTHSFVPSDFCKGIIVPVLKSKHGDATQLDMYRAITLSPVLSKLFELVLHNLFENFLVSVQLQFGFKKKSSCSHALFAFNESVKYYMSIQTKVYTAFLDASKHVDDLIKSLRLSGYGLYIGQMFVGCLMYAHDIVLMSPSCFGLRMLVMLMYVNSLELNGTLSLIHTRASL